MSIRDSFLLASSIVISLLLCEVAARWLEMRPIESGNQYAFYQFDGVLGWSNRPHAAGTMTRAEFRTEVRINGAGRRDSLPEPLTDGRRRIAILGDSFVWGVGATQQERFPDLLNADGRYQVLNFGVSGYGPIHYLLQLEQVLKERPAAVVIAFCLGNDFVDSVQPRRYGYSKPFADIDGDGTLRILGYPLSREANATALPLGPSANAHAVWRWLFSHSALMRRAGTGISLLLGLIPSGAETGGVRGNQAEIYRRAAGDSEGEAGRVKMMLVTRALLAQIRDKLRAAETEMLVMAIPTKCEYGDCITSSPALNPAARDLLSEILTDLSIPLLDATPHIGPADFWSQDGHWRASGHAKAASLLKNYLER